VQLVLSFVRSSVCLYIPSVRSSVPSPVHSAVHLPVCLSVLSFVCSFFRPFVCPFVRLFVRSFVRPFVCPFVRPFVRLFVLSFVFSSVIRIFSQGGTGHPYWPGLYTYCVPRCAHKAGATPMMSVHGKVTDFQMWDRILPDEELLKVQCSAVQWSPAVV
jgi:hypothetical protein